MTSNFSIVQCIFNREQYAPEEMQRILREAEQDESSAAKLLADDAMDINPVRTAVMLAMGNNYPNQELHYVSYMEMFMAAMKNMLHTEAVVECVPCQEDEEQPCYAASQCLDGDIRFVAGLIASEPVYLKLAERYSEEELPEMDEMAQDSIEEFINVLNGMFSVSLGEEKIETDLGLPRFGKNVSPQGKNQLRLRVHSSIGSFQVVMATDEFF